MGLNFRLSPTVICILALSACDANVAAPDRCNADVDCEEGEACRDGECIAAPSTAAPTVPEPSVEPGVEPGAEPGVEPGPTPEPGVDPRDGGPGDGGLPDGGLTDGGPSDGGADDWWNRRWGARRGVVFTTPDGVDASVQDFPVQVRLEDNDVEGARADFGDVRFVDAAGAEMAMELERTDGENAIFWVRIDTFAPGEPVAAWVYFDNPDATARPYQPDVWRNGFAGVWHFEDERLQNRADYTLRKPSLNAGAGVSPDVTGGLLLDGENDSVTLATNTEIGFAVDVVTLSARVRLPNVDSDLQIVTGISVADEATSDRSRASLAIGPEGSVELYGRRLDSEEYVNHVSDADVISADQWHHLSGTLDYINGTVRVYVDGALVLDAEQVFSETAPTLAPRRIVVGGEDDIAGAHFGGELDEVRISSVARSDAWRTLEFRQLQSDVFTLSPIERQARVLVGNAPAPGADVIALEEDAAEISLVLVDNDTDAEDDPLFIVGTISSALGTLRMTPDQRGLTFLPTANTFGTEEHDIEVSDGTSGSVSTTLSISITSINDLPIARFDRVTMRPGETATINQRVNDEDIETTADDLEISFGALPVGLDLDLTPNGLTQVSAVEQAQPGEYRISYTITDEAGATASSNLFVGIHNAPESLIFEDMSDVAGIGRTGAPSGIAVIDANQDGRLDVAAAGTLDSSVHLGSEPYSFSPFFLGEAARLFTFANVDGIGPLEGIQTRNLLLFRSDGASYVADETAGTLAGNAGSLIWAHLDEDQDIDLFVADSSDPFANFQMNDGTGVFTRDADRVDAVGGDEETSTAVDVNNDGLPDFLVMATNVRFFVSQPDGSYVDEATIRGLRDETIADPYAGVAFGDCDNDGDFDLAMGGRGGSRPRLYVNNGGNFDRDANFDFAVRTGVGIAWGDVDNDRQLDLFIGGGSARDTSVTGREVSVLLMNSGDCTFSDAAYTVDLQQPEKPIASAVLVDLDRDGDLDLVANRQADTIGLFDNKLAQNNGFRVVVREEPNLDGVRPSVRGAVVTLEIPGDVALPTVMTRQISGGEGYYAQGPDEVHFGLGAVMPPSVEVRVVFPSTGEVVVTTVDPNDSSDDGPRSLVVTP